MDLVEKDFINCLTVSVKSKPNFKGSLLLLYFKKFIMNTGFNN